MWTDAARQAAIAARAAKAQGNAQQGGAGAHSRGIVNLPRGSRRISAGRTAIGAVLGLMAGATSAILKSAMANGRGMGGGRMGRKGR